MSPVAWEREALTLGDGSKVEAICPVIISASRATDIPAFHSRWFRDRLQAGYIRWQNPFNANQLQYVSFSRTRVVVFWSKNPRPLMQYLPEVDAKGINYYFQFTLNDYTAEGLEPHVPPLSQRVDTFKALSEKIGKQRVVWRFDPLILTDTIGLDELVDRVASVGELIHSFTERLVISFADIGAYRKVQNNLVRAGVAYREFTPELMHEIGRRLQALNRPWGLRVATCAETVDLNAYGIEHNKCIDDQIMIEAFPTDRALMDFLGWQPDLFAGAAGRFLKDSGQRKECGCIVSKDVGMYDTCPHLCSYCYANTSCKAVENNMSRYRSERAE